MPPDYRIATDIWTVLVTKVITLKWACYDDPHSSSFTFKSKTVGYIKTIGCSSNERFMLAKRN